MTLTKADNGVWSATIGPIEPNAYRYRFIVNGAAVVDPRNVAVSQDNTGVQSVLFVPGPAADFMASQAVPHGAVREVTYRSSSLGFDRRMHIYTPPGYDLGANRYPVLYRCTAAEEATTNGAPSVGQASSSTTSSRPAKPRRWWS